jgi:hypothetical protein
VINELDPVVLTRDIPEDRLEKGDVGTVVLLHAGGKGLEVEFITLTGETLAVVTLPADAVRAVEEGEIPHVRHVA